VFGTIGGGGRCKEYMLNEYIKYSFFFLYFTLYIYTPFVPLFVFHVHFPSLSFSLTFSFPKRPSLCSNGRPAHRRPDRRVQGGLQPLRQGWRWSFFSDPSLSFSVFSLCFTFLTSQIWIP